jgi:serine protease Do
MRITALLAAAAVSSGANHTATAQTGSRVRVAAPPAPSGAYRIDAQPEHRAALGIGTSATGTLRDTLGLLITSVTAGSPAAEAGLEEGNRLAAINGTSLRTSAVDVEDGEMSGALTRRLTRQLARSKPGDDVSLSVFRDGRMQTVKVKTADSDVLFARGGAVRMTRSDRDDRAAIGIMLGNTGSRRDTLGVLVMGVTDSTPAARAGLEEGNRIAAINGVNLRVAREDAGDHLIGSTKAERLQRAISDLKAGDNVTLKVYANGQFRDVSMKAARAGDLPRNSAAMFMGDGFSGLMRAMPAMPPMPQMERLRMELPRAIEQMRMVPRMRMTVVV